MASSLIREDDQYLYLYKYVHANDDELPDWFIDKEGNWKYPEAMVLADDRVGYEVRISYHINKETFEVVIDEITP